MRARKIGHCLFCVIFFLLILTPVVSMPWADGRLAENRPPAPPPELFRDGSLNFSVPGEAEEYFKDRFGGRTQMIDAYSRLVGGLFGVSANDRVVMGRDGWLFFAETMGDYDGSSALDDDELDFLVSYLLGLSRMADERGQVFLIAVAPNKNTIYGEFMHARYRRDYRASNLDRLLMVEGLDIIDLSSSLLGVDELVYYKTDSHWNGLGSRIAAHEIMLAIEEKTGVKAGIDLAEGVAFDTIYITGDLGRMLFPASPPQESDRFYDDSKQGYSTVGRYRGLDDMNITTESGGAHLRVAMYRDSFADALIPYLSNAYSNVFYTRQSPPPMDNPAFLEADVIIFQMAERRLGEILGFWG